MHGGELRCATMGRRGEVGEVGEVCVGKLDDRLEASDRSWRGVDDVGCWRRERVVQRVDGRSDLRPGGMGHNTEQLAVGSWQFEQSSYVLRDGPVPASTKGSGKREARMGEGR